MEVLNEEVDKWEIAPSRIILQEIIGIGSFGAVWKANFNAPDGRARRMPVAAKCFTRELDLLNSFTIIINEKTRIVKLFKSLILEKYCGNLMFRDVGNLVPGWKK